MKIKLLTFIFCILFLTGCWDRKELNELGLVLATGLDKDNNTGKISITAQVVRPGALKKQGGSEEPPIELVTAKGNTVFEAIRNITKQFDRRGYYAHNKVLVIDEQLAKSGLDPFLDFFERSQEMRRLVWVMVAKNTTAKQILGVKHGIENVQATYLDNIIKRRITNSEVTAVNLLEFLKKVSGSGINPITGVMEIVEQINLPAEEKKGNATKGVRLSGTAVFKKDKLVGYLDDTETRGLNWVTGKVKSGIINVPALTEKDKLIAIEIKRASSKIKPTIDDNGKISFAIEVKEEGNIAEQQDKTDVSKVEMFEKIQKEQIKVIEREINHYVCTYNKKQNSRQHNFTCTSHGFQT